MIRVHNTEPDFFGELGLAPTYVKPTEMFVARPKKKSGARSCTHHLGVEFATMAYGICIHLACLRKSLLLGHGIKRKSDHRDTDFRDMRYSPLACRATLQ